MSKIRFKDLVLDLKLGAKIGQNVINKSKMEKIL